MPQGLFQHADSFLAVPVFLSHHLQLPQAARLSLGRHAGASPALLLQGRTRRGLKGEAVGRWEFEVESALDGESGVMGVMRVVVVAFGVYDTAFEQGELSRRPIPALFLQSLLRIGILSLQISAHLLPSGALQT